MDLLIHSNQLPGGNGSREFEGKEHGAGLIDESEVEARAGAIVVAPAGTAHRFVNSGRDRLELTAIHHNANFVTEWLEPLTPEQHYWSAERR